MIAVLATAVAALVVAAGLYLREKQRNAALQTSLAYYRSELARLEQALHRFTAAPLVEDVIAHGAPSGGQRRHVTVMFADLQGFTSLSTQLDAEVMVQVLNGYFQAMSVAIAKHEGYVSKFMGDGLMAFFGGVEHNPWQARDGVLAALAMREALVVYNADLERQNLPQLKFGIGLHAGEVVIGALGSDRLMEYTVIGDVVNVAARVESLTRKHQTDILITKEIQQHLDERFVVRACEPEMVKGKAEPIATWAVEKVSGIKF